jgi:hypothetical protein
VKPGQLLGAYSVVERQESAQENGECVCATDSKPLSKGIGPRTGEPCKPDRGNLPSPILTNLGVARGLTSIRETRWAPCDD